MKLKIVATSDLHFGNIRINAELMYEELKKTLYPELVDAHLFILAGDLLDQLLTVGSKAHIYASRFIKDIFSISAKTGLVVRILVGTYTHDRDQIPIFKALAIPRTKVKIIDKIDCEVIKGFTNTNGYVDYDLKIGYLPDNLSYKESSDAVAQLHKAMDIVGISTLDTCIIHGTFTHTVRPGASFPPCTYSVSQFKFVNGPIICGHIHTASRKQNVYYCGSWERMSHGEEENKGFYVFLNEDGKWSAKFIINPDASKFITITPPGADVASTSEYFLSEMKKYFTNDIGHVRVIHKNADIRALLHKICNQQYPDVIFTSKALPNDEEGSMQVEDIEVDTYNDVKPDVNNLGDLVFKFLSENKLDEGIPESTILAKVKELLTINGFIR